MRSNIERDVKHLKIYCMVVSLVWVVTVGAAFAPGNRKQRFDEVDVERLNIIERTGQVKMVISNKDRLPDPGNIVSQTFGKKRAGPKGPGILFYNEGGDEMGGLIYTSIEQNHAYGAGGGLTFDRYRGSQVIGVQYQEQDGKISAGLNVWDQPAASPEEQKRNYTEAHKLGPGPERDQLLRQAVGYRRIYVGRSMDRSAEISLADGDGRPRLRMRVEEDGAAKLEFLDGTGRVVKTVPDRP